MRFLPLLFGISLAQILPFEHPLPILTSPVIQAKAGRDLHFQSDLCTDPVTQRA